MLRHLSPLAAIPRGCARAGLLAAILIFPFVASCRAISSTLSEAEFHSSPAAEHATELQSVLGERFRLHSGRHFIVVSDARGGDAQFVLSALSQLHNELYPHASAIGLSPKPLRDRLVCVLFERRAAYEDYLRRVEGDATDWSSGHYSHDANVVVLHHDRDNPALSQRGHAAETRPAATAAALAAVAELATLHKARHEAAHQLLYNSGVLVRGRRYPAWIDEGLATLFETQPTELNPFRLAIYRRMQGEGSLLSVRELIDGDLRTIEPDGIGRYYTQAWAFTCFLWNRHPERLVSYLNELRSGIDPEWAFSRQIGQPDELEPEFRRFMDGID